MNNRCNMRVAYFVNEYPAISHSFIRREIKAMEALGVSISRYAIRPSNLKLVDKEDEQEQLLTRYVLQTPIWRVGYCLLGAWLNGPEHYFEQSGSPLRSAGNLITGSCAT